MTDKITPSQTALFSAAARAAHPLVDDAPHLLDDIFAARLCSTTDPSPLDYQLAQPEAPVLAAARLSTCVRSRAADDAVTQLGGSQVVVLGGGLDTLSHRVPASSQGQIWVVDRPGVLAWRSQLFKEANLTDTARLVSADLENGLDLDTLTAAGLDLDRPVVVIWHGVSMYISPVDCRRLFADLAHLSKGSMLLFDYILSPDLRDAAGTAYANALAAMAGQVGEPWLCATTPETMQDWLSEAGWRVRADLDEQDVTPAGFWDRTDHLHPMRLVRLVQATR